MKVMPHFSVKACAFNTIPTQVLYGIKKMTLVFSVARNFKHVAKQNTYSCVQKQLCCCQYPLVKSDSQVSRDRPS